MSRPKITVKDIERNSYEVDPEEISWRPSAHGIVIHEGKMLLVKVKQGYVTPGGGIEISEDSREAVVREVYEETGIEVEAGRLLGIEEGFYWHDYDGPVKSIVILYECLYKGGEINNDNFVEYDEGFNHGAEWVDLDDIAKAPDAAQFNWKRFIELV